MALEQQLLDRLHEEALIENEERDWYRTGQIRCVDCDTMVRTRTLETLPPHRCTERQRARRERETADRAGRTVDDGLDRLFRRLGPPAADHYYGEK
ncbi:hypothetical protein [Streptomyces mexicanus]|uniref:hypothetical protein n=1 Tax=Streptomyces mexicanus TaxID=178566 RepID=UPI0036519DD3